MKTQLPKSDDERRQQARAGGRLNRSPAWSILKSPLISAAQNIWTNTHFFQLPKTFLTKEFSKKSAKAPTHQFIAEGGYAELAFAVVGEGADVDLVVEAAGDVVDDGGLAGVGDAFEVGDDLPAVDMTL